MDWWMLISRLTVVVGVAVGLQILSARRYQKRMARLEALRGDWDREAHWVGVVVRGAEGAYPEAMALEAWRGFPARRNA